MCINSLAEMQSLNYCRSCGTGPSALNVEFKNSCRTADPTSDCTTCTNSPSVDYTTLPKYTNYISGCMGRPIDIDTDSCNGKIRPQDSDFSVGKTSFVLYYSGGPTKPFLIIDNVAYDPRGATGLIKVFTTSTPTAMRNMVCERLRFATLKDATKLGTDLSAALDSNWPYNDLYWFSACGNLPTEVPINLIPC